MIFVLKTQTAMSPKVKMFLICTGTFFVLFTVLFGTFMLLTTNPTFWTTLIPAGIAWAFAPKPYVEETATGTVYGVKLLFSNKIWKL